MFCTVKGDINKYTLVTKSISSSPKRHGGKQTWTNSIDSVAEWSKAQR